MKKIILGLAALMFCGVAHAANPVFDVGYSQYASVGIKCTSGTAVQINASLPSGFRANVAEYVISNQDSSHSVFIGGPSVSTSTVAGDSIANLGAPIAANGSKTILLNKDYRASGSPLVPIFCKAADAAGANGSIITVEWLGY